MKNSRFERGIYFLPNLMTTAALFAGFYAVIAGLNGQFEAGAMAIFIAMVFDGLDGRIARLTNSTSAFGAEYDSLADMVSFGLAPALLLYSWGVSEFGKLGWLAAFVYVAGAALRLARFNVQAGSLSKKYFQGLPSPAAAAWAAGWIWVVEHYALPMEVSAHFVGAVLLVLAGLLMVSNVRYFSGKELNLKKKVPFVALLVMVLVLVVIAIEPALILWSFFSLYALSGPVITLRQLQLRRRLRAQARENLRKRREQAAAPEADMPPKNS
ncbi:CDP-diacylglycerol--serine O-phosphatidyltransferase [Sulfurivirga sp.]|uniref:CDP-diacylglycerol--serine O-phosphatidyltransferase n=1 Tax=Sulfurivirga sp. TaxID=2614236 RepID=UPI0025E0533E|nr:CDP-diacylglycerol--serine O-phosphatidyltransferase [Sulfurivirga sp.]